MDSSMEAFLRRRREGRQVVSYRSVVREDEATVDGAEDAKEAKAQAGGGASAMPEMAWWGFLGRPWSRWWRWVLGGGAVACVTLAVLMWAAPQTHSLYAVVMAIWVPATVVTFFCEVDATRRVTWPVALMVALLGGALGVLLSLAGMALTGITAVPLAGVIEEPAKGVALLILAMMPRRFPGILSGLALGACVGAGFAAIETVMYAYRFGADGLPSSDVLILRGVLAPFAHIAWTSALGGALWAARGPDRSGWAALAEPAVWGILAGMVALHCLWNLLGPLTHLSALIWVFLFRLVKRGAAEAIAWGFAPKGV